MDIKRDLDRIGIASLATISFLLGWNQVIIKLMNTGISPVFGAGLRSAGAALVVLLWMRILGQRLDFRAGTVKWGLIIGVVFSIEFLGLFTALDISTVARSSVIFYSMPVWMALAAHFLLPGERLTGIKVLGTALAFGGVAWAILDRGAGVEGEASPIGDIAALIGAFGWMGVTLIARATPLSQLRPEMQMLWQVAVSGVMLTLLAPLFGPVLRDPGPWHWAGLGFQAVFVAAGAFLWWFWLLTRYKASSIASFAFLTPVLSVGLGWLVLDEPLSATFALKLLLVALGIVLINRPTRQS